MRRILVALDGSPAQALVLAEAIALAKARDAKLVLYRAVTLPRELPLEALAVSPSDVQRILLTEAEADLARLGRSVPAATLDKGYAELGTPWHAVVDAAVRERVELIVIGSHGYGGIDRLLGTTAAKIVDHAKCSVLVVRPAA